MTIVKPPGEVPDPSPQHDDGAAREHRGSGRDVGQISVNGRTYSIPRGPTVVFTIDGGAPSYIDDALDRGLMPAVSSMLASGGRYAVGSSEMPSVTNVNNLSIVTGAPPAIHGIPGNSFRSGRGDIVLLNDPRFLRAISIHAALREQGVPVLMVTVKDKLRRLLGAGEVPSVSAERASELPVREFGITSITGLVGEPAPGIYDPAISQYAMKIGLEAHRACGGLRLLYVSLTDRVQHAAPPGHPLSDAFYKSFDTLLSQYLDEGFTVGITADHGMSSKHDNAGSPRILFLEEILRDCGVMDASVVLPIADPYVRHHGSLGSFAWVYLPDEHTETARSVLAKLNGIEEVYLRQEAAVIYQHPADRIGTLSVSSDAATALGTTRAEHDVSALHAPLRSHGGRHEQLIPILTSRPLTSHWDIYHRAGAARNRDIHDLVLNGTAPQDR
jgi:phosphonoacetate hydrolase